MVFPLRAKLRGRHFSADRVSTDFVHFQFVGLMYTAIKLVRLPMLVKEWMPPFGILASAILHLVSCSFLSLSTSYYFLVVRLSLHLSVSSVR